MLEAKIASLEDKLRSARSYRLHPSIDNDVVRSGRS